MVSVPRPPAPSQYRAKIIFGGCCRTGHRDPVLLCLPCRSPYALCISSGDARCLHARCNAQRSGHRCQDADKHLKHCFPSVTFHSLAFLLSILLRLIFYKFLLKQAAESTIKTADSLRQPAFMFVFLAQQRLPFIHLGSTFAAGQEAYVHGLYVFFHVKLFYRVGGARF